MPLGEESFFVRAEVIALFALAHTVFANLAFGLPLLALLAHRRSLGTGARYHERAARSLARFNTALCGVVAALALGAIFIVAGLWPAGWQRILSLYLRPLALEVALFLGETILLAYYAHLWRGRGRPGALPLAVGALAVLCGLGLLLVVNDEGAAVAAAQPYVFATAGVGAAALVDRFVFLPAQEPRWLPLALYRIVGAVAFTGLLMATLGAILQIGARQRERQDYLRWLTGFALRSALLPMLAVPGILLLYTLAAPVQTPADLLALAVGDLRWAFAAELGLMAILFLLGAWYVVRALAQPGAWGSGARVAAQWTTLAGLLAIAAGAFVAWQRSGVGGAADLANWSIVGGLVLLYVGAFAALQWMEDRAVRLSRGDRWSRYAGALLPFLTLCTAVVAWPWQALPMGGFAPGELWQIAAAIGVASLAVPIAAMYLTARRERLLVQAASFSRLVPALAGVGAVLAAFLLGYVRDVAIGALIVSRQLGAPAETFAAAATSLAQPLPASLALWLLTLALTPAPVLAWLALADERPRALSALAHPEVGGKRRAA